MHNIEIKWGDASVKTSVLFGILIGGGVVIIGFVFNFLGIGLALALGGFAIGFFSCPTITRIEYGMSWPLTKYTVNLCSKCNQMKTIFLWPLESVCIDCKEKERLITDRGGGIT